MIKKRYADLHNFSNAKAIKALHTFLKENNIPYNYQNEFGCTHFTCDSETACQITALIHEADERR